MTKAIELSQLGNNLRVNSTGDIALGTSADHRGGTLTVGDIDSPTFARAAIAIKAKASDANVGTANLYLEESGGAEGYYINVDADGALLFSNSGVATPTLKLDDSDNVLIGKTSSSGLNAGCEFRPSGMGLFTRAEANPLQVRRLTNDGNFIEFYKDAGLISAVAVEGSLFTVAMAGTTRIRINSSGNVGIKCTPSAPLDVDGLVQIHERSSSTTARLAFRSATSNMSPTARIEFWENAVASEADAHAAIEYDGGTTYGGDGTLLIRGYTTSANQVLAGFSRAGNSFVSGTFGVNVTSPLSQSHVHLKKSSGSTAATRTKQWDAFRISLARSSGSSPYTGWGPAIDFYSDNYDGGTQRPNARIAGVVSNNSVNNDGGQIRFYTTPTDTATGEADFVERMRITSSGSVGIGNYTSRLDTTKLAVAGKLYVGEGSSALLFEEVNNGAALWLDGADGDFTGGDYYGIIANNSGELLLGYTGASALKITSDDNLHVGNYPTSFSVQQGAHLKVRSGTGAWGISLAMRSSQNDYGYIGFTDMNAGENLAHIYCRRTGASDGRIVFGTNSGNASGSDRMQIEEHGRVCISPTANFNSASTNIALSIVNNGGTGGYPGINLTSVASGGTTNSVTGMSIVVSDSNWNLYSNSGNVHGLGILTGNSSNSGNAAMYIRSDKKIIAGPKCYNELDTATLCHTAFHVAGGGLSVGSLGNSPNSTNTSHQGGRNVLGWYTYGYYGTDAYAHLTTSLWGGGSPYGQSEYIMGGFRIHGYRYNSSGVSEEMIYFHNWGGGLANYSRYHHGNWNPGNTVYVNSNGYVTLRLTNAQYYGYDIDLIQYHWYPIRQIEVTAVTYSNSTSI